MSEPALSLDDVFSDPLPVAPGVTRGGGRPKGHKAADGGKVPSVTTITGRFKESGGLMWWHWQRGAGGKDWMDRGDAADVGSVVHACVEAAIHGESMPPVPAEFAERVKSALDAWNEWWTLRKFEIVATELPLVSEVHRFGGTIDCVMRDHAGRLCIGDWKSSKAIYPDMLWQVAAYGLLWNEKNPEQVEGGFHIVKFSKTDGDMEHRYFPKLDDALELFLLLRKAYEMDKLVAKRAK